MILYGTRTFKFKKGHTSYKHLCDHCNNECEWELFNMWTWVTLFFIPIFPVYKKTVLVCPICGTGIKVNRNNREEIMREIEIQ